MTMHFWLYWLQAFFIVIAILMAGVVIVEFWPWKDQK